MQTKLDISVRRSVFKCPACGKFDNGIIDSRDSLDASTKVRTRSCNVCRERWKTIEISVEEYENLKNGFLDRLYKGELKQKVQALDKRVSELKGTLQGLSLDTAALKNLTSTK